MNVNPKWRRVLILTVAILAITPFLFGTPVADALRHLPIDDHISPSSTSDGRDSVAIRPGYTPIEYNEPMIDAGEELPLAPDPFVQFFPLYHMKSAMTPVNPSPSDHARLQSPNLNLTWHVLDETYVSHYEVYLQAGKSDPRILLATVGETALDPPTLAIETTYNWKVVAVSDRGQKIAGPVWKFTTMGPFTEADVGTMVTVPAGEFLMGCDATDPRLAFPCIRKETPLHPVYLEAYEIDKYEVTNVQYRACVNAGACELPRKLKSHRRDSYYLDPDFDHYPVLYVSWWDGQDYCGWAGKRLPTEAEWEKAARGVIDVRPWPWGVEAPDCSRLNYTDDSREPWIFCVGDTNRVGSYPSGASPYGAMDMAGNAFEWVADVYKESYYSRSPYYDPQGPNTEKSKDKGPAFVLRGGSYRPRWYYQRVPHRHWGHHGDIVGGDSPLFRNDQVGFRCARSIED